MQAVRRRLEFAKGVMNGILQSEKYVDSKKYSCWHKKEIYAWCYV